jgi:hypothetical protein
LGMLDEAGKPTERYYRFLDQAESKKVLAEGIKEAYDDLFKINVKAYELSDTEVKNKFRTLTQGKKSEDVISKMASTFVTLSSLADWSPDKTTTLPHQEKLITEDLPNKSNDINPKEQQEDFAADKINLNGLHYNIQIHLPESRDPAVYDAIFQSLKKHLL